MAEDKRIQRIIASVDAVNAGQEAIEPTVDTGIGAKTSGFKDGDGVARRHLLKDQNAPVNNLIAAGTSTAVGQTTGVNVKQGNLTATADPTVNDDSSAGYGDGSLWLNRVASPPTYWLCRAASPVGQADWIDITGSVAGGATTQETTGWEDINSYTLAFNDSLRQVTVSNESVPVPKDNYTHWQNGIEYRKTTPETYVIPDDEGLHLVYYVLIPEYN